MQKLLAIARSRKTRIAFNALSAAIATVVGVLLSSTLPRTEGWPLSGAKVARPSSSRRCSSCSAMRSRRSAGGACLLPASGRLARTRLRRRCNVGYRHRPSGALRRARPGRGRSALAGWCAGVGGVCLSLLLLGLIDSAALAPLAGICGGRGDGTDGAIPRRSDWRRGCGDRSRRGRAPAAEDGPRRQALAVPARSLAPRALHVTTREATKAWALVSLSWLVRAAALFVLLDALALDASIPLALAFLCASAAAAALPIAPAGAATEPAQVRRCLIASGIGPFSGDRLRDRRAGPRDHDGRADPGRRGPLASQPPPAAAPGLFQTPGVRDDSDTVSETSLTPAIA